MLNTRDEILLKYANLLRKADDPDKDDFDVDIEKLKKDDFEVTMNDPTSKIKVPEMIVDIETDVNDLMADVFPVDQVQPVDVTSIDNQQVKRDDDKQFEVSRSIEEGQQPIVEMSLTKDQIDKKWQIEDMSHPSAVRMANVDVRAYFTRKNTFRTRDVSYLDDQNAKLTEFYMQNVIQPIEYFEWGLNKNYGLDKYAKPFALELIKSNPLMLLDRGYISGDSNLDKLLPTLFDAVIKYAGQDKSFNGDYLREMQLARVEKRLGQLGLDIGSMLIEHADELNNPMPLPDTIDVMTKNSVLEIAEMRAAPEAAALAARDLREYLKPAYPKYTVKRMQFHKGLTAGEAEKVNNMDEDQRRDYYVKLWGNKDNADLTKYYMDRLVESNPLSYFEWDLVQKPYYAAWIVRAAENLLKTNPNALFYRGAIISNPKLNPVLPSLFAAVTDGGKKDIRYFDDANSVAMMSKLGTRLSTTHPDFYIDHAKPYIDKVLIAARSNPDALKGNWNRTRRQQEGFDVARSL